MPKFEPVYFFSGTKEPPKNTRIDELKKIVLGDEVTEFNYNLFYADTTPAMDVVQTAETLSFDSPCKFIVVKRIDLYNAANKKLLTEYAANPNPSTCLVLVSSERPDKREAWYKNLAGASSEQVFWPYNEAQIIKMLHNIAAKHNKKIDADAAKYFAYLAGANVIDVDNEAKNIFDYVKDKQVVSVKDVHSMMTTSTTYDIYNWIMLITNGKYKEALKQFQTFSPREIAKITFVMYILTDRYIKFLKYNELLKEGLDAFTAQKKLGIIKFLDPDFHSTAVKHNTTKLSNIMDLILNADSFIKTGKGLPKHIVEDLIINIAKIMQ